MRADGRPDDDSAVETRRRHSLSIELEHLAFTLLDCTQRGGFGAPHASAKQIVREVDIFLDVLPDPLPKRRSAGVEDLAPWVRAANDVIAGQISLLKQHGVVLSNGEFGERLVDHARRFGLDFEVIGLEWGAVFDPREIRRRIASAEQPGWIWAVHCETSTGVLNDLVALKQICSDFHWKLCLDCISSIGTVPVDLSAIHLASCVSGKGLGAFPGLSMVFYNHDLVPGPDELPRYLDLGLYAAQEGIPFTHSSNLLFALQAALKRLKIEERFPNIIELSVQLRERLARLGYNMVASHEHASPAVLTLALPPELSSRTIGWQLQKAGYLLSYRSEYLLKRNWIQICLMGEFSREHLGSLLLILETYRPRRGAVAPGGSTQPAFA